MKKRVIILVSILIFSLLIPIIILAFDITSLVTANREKYLINEFEYELSEKIDLDDSDLKAELEPIAKKTTFLLLGKPNHQETPLEYYERHKEYLAFRYAPEVPRDENGELDENSQQYKEDIISGLSVPWLFNLFDQRDISYSTFEDIRVGKYGDCTVATVILPNVDINDDILNDNSNYIRKKTNLIIYYYYKKLDGEYKLYYLFGNTSDDLNQYEYELDSLEKTNTHSVVPTYNEDLKSLYDFSKLDSMTDSQFEQIYENNKNCLVTLNGLNENSIPASANGFFIKEDLIVTSWTFLEKALKEAQLISAADANGKIYNIEGIVTVNPNTNVAVLKTVDTCSSKVKIGDVSKQEICDPSIIISSRTENGYLIQKGITIQNGGYIQSSIPLVETDEGSALFNKDGEVIGMNTAKSINTNISLAINGKILSEIKDLFENKTDIKSIPFTNIKEKYYYLKKVEESIVIEDVNEDLLKEYKQFGKLDYNIPLMLTKQNFRDNKLTLRFKNNVIDNIPSEVWIRGYVNQLILEGFKKEEEFDKKTTLTNDNYKITILEELDYIIIGIEKI